MAREEKAENKKKRKAERKGVDTTVVADIAVADGPAVTEKKKKRRLKAPAPTGVGASPKGAASSKIKRRKSAEAKTVNDGSTPSGTDAIGPNATPSITACTQLVGDRFLCDPCSIDFTQNEVLQTFRNGQCIVECLQMLLDGELRKRDFPIMRVRWHRGRFFCLDNRRLALFRLFKFHAPPNRCSQVRVLRISDDEALKCRWYRKLTGGKFSRVEQATGRTVCMQPGGWTIGTIPEETTLAFGDLQKRHAEVALAAPAMTERD